jgi:hypothetical protein
MASSTALMLHRRIRYNSNFSLLLITFYIA